MLLFNSALFIGLPDMSVFSVCQASPASHLSTLLTRHLVPCTVSGLWVPRFARLGPADALNTPSKRQVEVLYIFSCKESFFDLRLKVQISIEGAAPLLIYFTGPVSS